MRAICLGLAVVLALTGCVTTYQGPPPDLTLTGAAAEREVEKFTLSDNYWLQGYCYRIGTESEFYSVKSIQPIVEHVAPKANNTIDAAKAVRTGALVAALIAVASWVAAANVSNDSARTSYSTMGWIGLGSSLGLTFAWTGMLSSAATEYNKELKSKLTPTVGMNLSF